MKYSEDFVFWYKHLFKISPYDCTPGSNDDTRTRTMYLGWSGCATYYNRQSKEVANPNNPDSWTLDE